MKLLSNLFKNESKYYSYIKYNLPIKNYYLIKWNPRAWTNIHNHEGKQCDYMVLNGILRESRFQRKDINSFIKTDKLVPFTKYSINDTIGYHQMYNHEDRVKWSIHRYY